MATFPGRAHDPLQDKLARLGITRQADLRFHLPLRFENETAVTPIARLELGTSAVVEARVLELSAKPPQGRPLSVMLDDGSGVGLQARWFHVYPGLLSRLSAGRRVRLFGEVKRGYWGLEMVHPRLDEPTQTANDLPDTLTPIYPTTQGLTQAALRKLIAQARKNHPLVEWLPPALLAQFQLWALPKAVAFLHAPPPDTRLSALENRTHPAWRRIKFEEWLVQQVCLRTAYERRKSQPAQAFAPSSPLLARFRAQLPFSFTPAQERVLSEIVNDLSMAHPMQRLLQGDVGSGKTVVAAHAMLHCVAQGAQAVMMAPTDILAEQHYRKLSAWFAPLGLPLAWICSGRRKAEREADLAALANQSCLLAVGTHALLEETVRMPGLALAVIDEQHRFGVHQRLALRQKNEAKQMPHLLMMSATPIPRTLAMSFYADLDVSVIDELPPGRVPVVTKLLPLTRREKVIRALEGTLMQGRQAYWVCPLIEESETLDLQTALEAFSQLECALPNWRIGLLHGRLRNEEKTRIMTAFTEGSIKVLVATTVVEVGVDVPNASVMVIEHAERFGLAQLHQLRGRIGRGAAASVCILLYAQPLSENGRARLRAIHTHTDGFAIAREDLAIRGPGEFIGARQSGVPMLRYACIDTDEDLIDQAREAATVLAQTHPEVIPPILERWPGLSGLLLEA